MSDGIEIYVMLLTANLILLIIAIGDFAGKFVGLVIGAMAILILINLYKISPEAERLRKETLKNKRLLLMQRKKLNEQKKLLDRQTKEVLGTSEEEKVMAEVSKISEQAPTRSGMRAEYWEKLEREFGEAKLSPDEVRLVELKNKRNEIQNLIELSKKKYDQRVLNKQTFREITKDYQQKLIEVENEISKLDGKRENE